MKTSVTFNRELALNGFGTTEPRFHLGIQFPMCVHGRKELSHGMLKVRAFICQRRKENRLWAGSMRLS